DRARSKSAFDQAEAALGYQNTGDYYQTPRRDLAGLLALAGEARDTARITRVNQALSQQLPEPDRLTTQEKAFLLLAANALSGGQWQVTVNVQGDAQTVTAGRVFRRSETQAARPPTFTNGGQSQLWVTSIARGAPSAAPPAAADGMMANKQLWSMTGGALDG